MEYLGEDFKITFDAGENRVNFNGSIRLWDNSQYQKILVFMLDIHALDLPYLGLDFMELEFLNSAGISMLCKFVLEVKKIDKMQIFIIVNKNILWQVKSFKNMKLLWDKINLEYI